MLTNADSWSLSRGCVCHSTQKVWTKEQEGFLSWFINFEEISWTATKT